ncbi:MAG: hypothetical protein GXO90_11320 [FCB group bacterium]|nr:hypothetical protein [FCB group bacterium]
MKRISYLEFHEALSAYTVFSVQEIRKHFPRFDTRRLVEWQERKYLYKLRNRYYCFTSPAGDESRLIHMANALYRPSYVSLESALARYGFIPEGVFQMISCTPLKTQTFTTPVGTFVYRHLKPTLYFGYRLENWQDRHLAIADPEKTLIDYVYLHSQIRDTRDFSHLRWNRQAIRERISLTRITDYDTRISSPAVHRRINLLKRFLYAESD